VAPSENKSAEVPAVEDLITVVLRTGWSVLEFVVGMILLLYTARI
jgi:hypothetical protein